MFYWSQIPLVRMVIPLIIGSVLFKINNKLFSIEFLLLVTLLLLFVLLVALFKKDWQKYRFRWLFGALANLVFIILGFCLSYMHHLGNPAQLPLPGSSIMWIGELRESPSRTAKSVRAIVEIKKIKEGHADYLKGQKILVYIKQDSSSLQLETGDLIIGNSYFNEIENAQNPAQFNYARFMANRAIQFQTYVQEWSKITESINIYRIAAEFREYLMHILKEAGLDDDDFAVASALTLGYDNELDYQIRNAYSGSGAMHILSVSGLHVGIIYLVIGFLTRFMKKNRHMRLIRCLLLIASLWFYALITGLSPPVQRSAFMFSFIVLAEFMGRHNNIFNSLAASILVLVLINPNIIFEVGFQLSYSAVIGIVLIHPKIYPLLEFDNPLWDKIWSLMVVSIAAQLATLPFALFYFHQFPNLFLLTNLIVVPLAFVILISAIALYLIYALFSSTLIIGSFLKIAVSFLNKSVIQFYQLPFSVTDGIYISVLTCLLIIAAIAFFIAYLHFYKAKYLLICTLFLSIISIGQLLEFNTQKRQEVITLYDIRRKMALSSTKGKNSVVFANFNRDDPSYSIVKNHLDSLGVTNVDWLNSDSLSSYHSENVFYEKNNHAQFISLNNLNIVIPNTSSTDNGKLPLEGIEHYVLLVDNAYNLPCFPASKLIFNPSIPEYQRKWMIDDLKDCGTPIISDYRSINLN